MRLLTSALLLLLLAGLLAPGVAAAHELTVLDPGAAELDLGTGSIARLVHGTLVNELDAIELSVGASSASRDLLLLVPHVQPERGAAEGALPTISAGGLRRGDDETILDEATGIEYRVVARGALGAGASVLTVQRGVEPTRVAVWVGDRDAAFAASDPERTPRALLRLRAWAETPAEGSRRAPPAARGGASSAAPWNGLAIALLALMTAAWWVRTGRARSRKRGAERAREAD